MMPSSSTAQINEMTRSDDVQSMEKIIAPILTLANHIALRINAKQVEGAHALIALYKFATEQGDKCGCARLNILPPDRTSDFLNVMARCLKVDSALLLAAYYEANAASTTAKFLPHSPVIEKILAVTRLEARCCRELYKRAPTWEEMLVGIYRGDRHELAFNIIRENFQPGWF